MSDFGGMYGLDDGFGIDVYDGFYGVVCVCMIVFMCFGCKCVVGL